MSFISRLFGNSSKPLSEQVMTELAQKAGRTLTDPWQREFVGHSLNIAHNFFTRVTTPGTIHVIETKDTSSQQLHRGYKHLLAYFWMTMIARDPSGVHEMKSLLTSLTDGNLSDTNTLCDPLIVAFRTSDGDDPRFGLGIIMWDRLRSEIATKPGSESIVYIALPAVFDAFHASVRPTFS
jgi:hypothetical protein